jgi:TRAP-type C4-dicarboxylate transport system substrate-binding protein
MYSISRGAAGDRSEEASAMFLPLRRSFQIVTLLLLLTLLAVGCGTDTPASDDAADESDDVAADGDDGAATEFEPLTITFSSSNPAGGIHLGFEWWAEELEKRTNGAVTVEAHYLESLVAGIDTANAISDGRIDAGMVIPGFVPDKFPLWNIVGVPFQTHDPVALAQLQEQMHEENEAFKAEFEANGLYPLLFVLVGTPAMGLVEPIDSIDDIQNRRMRQFGYLDTVFAELGAETVTLSTAELYEALQRGVVDGYGAWTFEIIPDTSLHEVAPYMYDIGMGHYSAGAVTFSTSFWEGLDPELRDLMTELAQESHAVALEGLRALEESACDTILESGASVTAFSEQEQQEIAERATPVAVEHWLERAGEFGVSEDVALDFREQWLEVYESHAEPDYETGVATCAARSE